MYVYVWTVWDRRASRLRGQACGFDGLCEAGALGMMVRSTVQYTIAGVRIQLARRRNAKMATT